MSKEETDESILAIRDAVKRLDAIINILFETTGEQKPISSGRRIEILYSAGLRPIEISRILGKSLANVSMQLGALKRKRSKKESLPEAEQTVKESPPSTSQ
jgi:hypothetical protein